MIVYNTRVDWIWILFFFWGCYWIQEILDLFPTNFSLKLCLSICFRNCLKIICASLNLATIDGHLSTCKPAALHIWLSWLRRVLFGGNYNFVSWLFRSLNFSIIKSFLLICLSTENCVFSFFHPFMFLTSFSRIPTFSSLSSRKPQPWKSCYIIK